MTGAPLVPPWVEWAAGLFAAGLVSGVLLSLCWSRATGGSDS